MNHQVAKQIFDACEKALDGLTQVDHAIGGIEDEAERRDLMKALSFVIADVLGTIRAPVVRQFPEVVPADEPGEPDDQLSEEDNALVSNLSGSDLARIDNALLQECANSWRKSARVAMSAMKVIDLTLPDLPVALYAQRIASLVQAGRLESQGNLSYLRFSEVRLPMSAPRAA